MADDLMDPTGLDRGIPSDGQRLRQMEPLAWEREVEFVEAFREFHAEFGAALDAGVPLATIVALLEREGMELPDFIRMML